MNKITLLLLLALLFACKKEKTNIPNNINEEKIAEQNTENISNIKIDSVYLETANDTVKALYIKNELQLLWKESENRNDLIKVIKNIKKEGLNPLEYNINNLKKWNSNENTLSIEDKVERDLLFSSSFVSFISAVAKGKLNPKELYNNWDLHKKHHFACSKGLTAIKNKKIATYISSLKPKHKAYASLVESLEILEKLPNRKFKELSIVKKIEPLDTVAILSEIKERLNYWGDLSALDSVPTNILDEKTIKAVEHFQTRHGLIVDGIIGFNTLKALNKDKEYRIKQTISNLERWRWYPLNFDNEYLLVNLPAYSLEYIKDDTTIESRRVVVGKKSRKTPVLISKLSNFVFNPTWTVPPTIVKKDLTPSATRNRSYFSRTRITIYDRSSGAVVSPYNWNPENAKNYRYVQKTGYNNSLGLVKFNFKNNHLVFLHDTNHRDYFRLENKALSSGCVRIENPLELAISILKNQGEEEPKETVDDLITKGKYTSFPVKKRVGIYLFYWTNWKSKNGLEFREDIYNYDEELYELLKG